MKHRPLALRLGAILISMPFALVLFTHLEYTLPTASKGPHYFQAISSKNKTIELMGKMKIYVVSLPERHARREAMETLRKALQLQWEYFDAVHLDNPLIGKILHWVQGVRYKKLFPDTLHAFELTDAGEAEKDNDDIFTFWPKDIDYIAHSNSKISLLDPAIWEQSASPPPYEPLTCNEHDFDVSYDSIESAPHFMRLTAGRVACWHSHLSVIHQHANTLPSESGKGSIALILEDDIDMEKDIVHQMKVLWADLPEDWDMVFLGHCWSNETDGRLLTTRLSSPTMNDSAILGSRMYTSTYPKCTHSYAISRMGARRLLLHLRYPPFAYSRAIDQAYAWLIKSGRIKAFSVVPVLAVQRKISVSDVMEGGTVNDRWKEVLKDGVLASLVGKSYKLTW